MIVIIDCDVEILDLDVMEMLLSYHKIFVFKK